jgi:hypothetical protein
MIMTRGSKRSAVSRPSNKSAPVLELDGMSTKTLYSHHCSFQLSVLLPLSPSGVYVVTQGFVSIINRQHFQLVSVVLCVLIPDLHSIFALEHMTRGL